ncbi:MAG: hypothetical protein HZA78_05560 [Candidatus Schekmanbacteria bacterium]|nr:hypothetical protein [Candidatus Schekmanbacteria bacterium]
MSTVNVNARLEPWMVQELDKEAKDLCTSRGAVIRMVIKHHVKEKYQKAGFNFERVKHLIGSVETGVSDLAQNHKKYLDEVFKGDK